MRTPLPPAQMSLFSSSSREKISLGLTTGFGIDFPMFIDFFKIQFMKDNRSIKTLGFI